MPGLKQRFHYHLLLCSSTPQEDAKKIRTDGSKIFTEISVYQIPVQCPLTEYATLIACDTTNLLDKIGDTFTGLDEVLKLDYDKWVRFAQKKFDYWGTAVPKWEMHKHSEVVAHEQILHTIEKGPFRPILQQVLASLANCEGYVDYDIHGWRLQLECGPSHYQCVCQTCCPLGSSIVTENGQIIYYNPSLPQMIDETTMDGFALPESNYSTVL